MRWLWMVVTIVVLALPAAAQDRISLRYKKPDEGKRHYLDSLMGPFDVPEGEVKRGFWDPPRHNMNTLYRELVLGVPSKDLTVGRTRSFDVTLNSIPYVQPFKLTCRLKLVSLKDGIAELSGQYSVKKLLPAKSGVRTMMSIRKLDCSYTAKYSKDEGAIVSAEYRFSYTSRYTRNKRDYPYPERSGKLKFISQKELNRAPTAKEIAAGIDKATKYLIDKQDDDGSWRSLSGTSPGYHAIAMLALLKAGVGANHKAIQKGLTYLDKQTITRTYDAGLYCMMMRALCEAREDGEPQRGAEKHLCNLTFPERDDLKKMVKSLVKGQSDGAWSYGHSNGRVSRFDNSNTQYAVLGLRSAAMCDCNPGEAAWRGVLRHFLGSQARDTKVTVSGKTARGWGYTAYKGRPRFGANSMTMTCAGAASVLIAQEQLGLLKKLSSTDKRKARRSLEDAVSWIEKHYTTQTQQRMGGPNGYLLYGLERVGVLADIARFGKHDWYAQGARQFLVAQADDGSVAGRYRQLVGTSFALLFWKRATMRIVLTRYTPEKPKKETPKEEKPK